MDIISHSLWAGAVFKFLNLKRKAKSKFSFWQAAFWGGFPDLISFGVMFIGLLIALIFGSISLSEIFNHHAAETSTTFLSPLFSLTGILYPATHSLIVFFIIFALVSLVFRKPIWTLCGWLIHILLDIFTHTAQFYPTKIFWPISNWSFNGIPWRTWSFMIIDVGLLILVYLYLWRKERKK